MRAVRLLQEAIEEAVAAAEWYDRESPGLGDEFSQAIEAAIDVIEESILPLSPLPGKPGSEDARQLILKRFPFKLIAIERADEVVVIAVAHLARRPGYWRERIKR